MTKAKRRTTMEQYISALRYVAAFYQKLAVQMGRPADILAAKQANRNLILAAKKHYLARRKQEIKSLRDRVIQLEQAIARAKAQFPYLEKVIAASSVEVYDRIQARGIIDVLGPIEVKEPQ